ncbi:unnamed protein product [Schistosoma margrebowiei]|uniref:Uncharacterized protein n=1 Tax=Schistosoma margrebowiei TaxID=48269 RepID=A0A183MAL9_9TREM|nr:unnamed protein product [Schistosoma margrebowiei]
MKFEASNDHLSLSTTSKSGIESHSSPELDETQNHCETRVSSKPTSYEISHVIVPDKVYPNYSHISDDISYKSEENMLSDSNHDRKPGAVLIEANFSDDSSLFNDILNKFEENISEESTPDVILYITYPHNAFASRVKLGQCENQVLNALDLDYKSDDLISAVVSPYHEVTSNEYTSQCEKCVLNAATSFIT